jgi:hypothetical protein
MIPKCEKYKMPQRGYRCMHLSVSGKSCNTQHDIEQACDDVRLAAYGRDRRAKERRLRNAETKLS